MSQDRMRQGDQFAMGLACGHPYVKPNEKCPFCGEFLREKQEVKSEDVGSLDELLKEKEEEAT